MVAGLVRREMLFLALTVGRAVQGGLIRRRSLHAMPYDRDIIPEDLFSSSVRLRWGYSGENYQSPGLD